MSFPFGQFLSRSPQETFELAYAVGLTVAPPAFFFLEGKLGVGKTVFAKGMICGLGQQDPDDVTSPTFTLINEYSLRYKTYHIDLYRLENFEDMSTLDLEEIFEEPAVIIVEWAEKLAGMMVNDAVRVKIQDCGDEIRQITITPQERREGCQSLTQ